MAKALIKSVTHSGDLLVDPFCGSGVIPFEAAALGRRVAAGDFNPYGVLISRAKLLAPATLETALNRFERTWRSSRRQLAKQDLRSVPSWVRSFFHPETLRSALALRDECKRRTDHFLLACLLSILHHQRPGFLSYPSSHLVPYLRNKNFPRSRFPHLYEQRDVKARMVAKITRMYKRPPRRFPFRPQVIPGDARSFPLKRDIQAIVTSPPYMNELDYVRDNRLRLWFIQRRLPLHIEISSKQRERRFTRLITNVCGRLAPRVRLNGYIVLILGNVSRGRSAILPERLVRNVFDASPPLKQFVLVRRYADTIPDLRRSRQECKGTKLEVVLIYKKLQIPHIYRTPHRAVA
jgi:hypothetical protein